MKLNCENCKHQFEKLRVRFAIGNDAILDKNMNPIRCEKCGSLLIKESPSAFKGFPGIGRHSTKNETNRNK